SALSPYTTLFRSSLGTLTTTLTGLGLVGARGRPQVMQLGQLVGVVVAHCATSSTVTRCETTVICPCTAGLSSRTVNLPIRPRPSEWRAACCFSLPPILERVCVILILAMVRFLPSPQRERAAWRPGPRPRSAGHDERRSPRAGGGSEAPSRWHARCAAGWPSRAPCSARHEYRHTPELHGPDHRRSHRYPGRPDAAGPHLRLPHPGPGA